MATRYCGPLVKKECEIFENTMGAHRFILAHFDSHYILYKYHNMDPITVILRAHLSSTHPEYAVITAEIFDCLLKSQNLNAYIDAFSRYQLTCTLHPEEGYKLVPMEHSSYKLSIFGFITQCCTCRFIQSYYRWEHIPFIIFEVPSISMQPYKYVIILGSHHIRTFLVRGINVFEISTYNRDFMLMEQTFENLAMPNIADVEAIFTSMCKDLHVQCCDKILKFLSVRSQIQYDHQIKQLSDDDAQIVKTVFSMKSHAENYAESIENLFNILNVPRVIFNIFLDYL